MNIAKFTPVLTCQHCNHTSDDYAIRQNGPHNSIYCGKCARWMKHLSKDDKYRTPEKMQHVAALTAHCCAYCGEMLGEDFTIDHVTAQVNGGGHEIENLFAVCKSCNSRKGKKTLEQYREYLRKKTGQKIVFFFEEVSDINSL